MRYAWSIVITCALLVGFAEAPLAHVHDARFGEDHHATEQAHAHVSRLRSHSDRVALDRVDPADDARMIDWFQIVPHVPIVLFVVPESTSIAEAPAPRDFIRAAPLICNHDPPLIENLSSRAPPSHPA